MRAMAENADSARLSGVWVRRTSTVAWTLAGVLSGYRGDTHLAGRQTLALTQVLSPDLLLLALTGALVGAMASLPITFIACVGVGIIYEVLQWNLTNPTTGIATQNFIIFVILLAVLLVRVGALKIGARDRSRRRLGDSGPPRSGRLTSDRSARRIGQDRDRPLRRGGRRCSRSWCPPGSRSSSPRCAPTA